MTLFIYNEHSILNNTFVRSINVIILVIILIFGIGITPENSLPLWVYIVSSILIAVSSSIIIEKVIGNTEFYEWDYTERKKKGRFIVSYTLMCVFICSLLMFSIIIAYALLTNIESHSAILVTLSVFPIVFFTFNLCNIISLYFPIFERDLTLAHKIQKKPENWTDNGHEITDEDEFKDRMYNDFRIRI